ncbi:hypothetical protein [Ruminococcus sp.]|uniref:hypothetical protein n=1 Tax=Ruminococcus sp. TaxID=41978 RepID=UPI002E7FDF07|nr:hypothetical protein [Ruminococcus sp.]MEE3439612.1 hypothetical protein [Ruminococcus sp.]
MTINLSDVVGITLNGSSVVKIEDTLGTVLWEKNNAEEYFYVENLTSSANTLSIKKSNNSAPTITVYYSTDKTTWTSMGSTSTNAITYSIPANSKVYLKATTGSWGTSGYRNQIACSSNYAVGGNIMSLLYGDSFIGKTVFPTNSAYNFNRLFYESTNLKNIDNLVLPATTLTTGCYYNMFNGCTSITKAPELPATTLTANCYNYMFSRCSSLNEITCYANDISASYCTSGWTTSVAATGTFYKKGSANWTLNSDNGIPTGWTVIESIDPINDYFYVENLTSSANTLSIKKNDSSAPTITVYRSTDKTTWTSMGDTSTSGISYSIPANSKVYLKTTTNSWCTDSYYNQIICSNNFGIGGNIMSLIYGDSFIGKTVFPTNSELNFYDLFFGSTYLKNIDNLILPATAYGCYRGMFQGCTGLTNIPSNLLPSTTLANYCYYSMFQDCTGLTSIPSNLLPATTLAYGCYISMFNNCEGLTTIPSNLLPATTLNNYCYGSMFWGCRGLTSIPYNLLPATTLADECYSQMFRNCTGLTFIPSNFLPATSLAYGCYLGMFSWCSGITTVPEDLLPATSLADECYYNMFASCYKLATAPDLLAFTGKERCYFNMFNGCTSLTSARVYLNNADDTTLNPTDGMFSSISTTGTLYKPIFLDHTNEWPWSRSSTSSTATGEYPYRWTIQAEIT